MNFKGQFKQLSTLLENTRDWWQFGAFHSVTSRWQDQASNFHYQLENARFGHDDFDASKLDVLNELLEKYIPQLTEIDKLTGVESVIRTMQAPSRHWRYQIAGRKWSQITRFSPHVPQHKHLLEWCAGKGHLGRLSASRGAQSLTSLEWDKNLCDKNSQLNQRFNFDDHFCPTQVVPKDVLLGNLDHELTAKSFVIALHACGDLHTELVKQITDHASEGVCLVPCCYNLIESSHYQPLSDEAKQSHLNLSRLDLGLPLREVVTAGRRKQSEQKRERLWRIAFDCWQREIRQVDEYLPLPTIPKKVLKGVFIEFISWACKRKAILSLQQACDSINETQLLDKANQRLPVVAQMEWVQNRFRRGLEIWLLLDQILFLEGKGYQCELIEFCEKEYTPRNLMIKAVRG
ncbi:MAG: SAM-dependent methyltransferase [Kangiellaceae bacterium]|nr:SAM-dependent methyltransferase [Kangiellaceae bacterium]